jgi:hypothetical protein
MLKPAAEAQTVVGMPSAAVTESDAVRLVVEPGAWTGYPSNLRREVLPLKVTVENRSEQPVRLRYEDFALESGQGVRYTPLPPFRIEGSVVQRAETPVYRLVPRFGYHRFLVAPWYMPYYVGLHPWRYGWSFSPAYYDAYYPRWEVDLPTSDMLERAMPEGSVEPGGMVTGFLYFPTIDDGIEHITFEAELTQGADGATVAALSVPFDLQ